jgi:hypothetical protein
VGGVNAGNGMSDHALPRDSNDTTAADHAPIAECGPAYAEWVAVDVNEETGVTVYADPGTIRRKENLVKVWHLNDFTTVQIAKGNSYLSIKAQHQYDGTEDRERIRALTKFSGNMGSGKVVYEDSNERKWRPIAPETTNQALRKIACKKK